MEPNPENYRFDLEKSLRSVVGLRATVPPDAHSAERLGTERAGNGCVISTDGLVVTVGYLVTEAESTWLVSSDGRVIPADVVGRDTESGFALVQALEPLDVDPLKLGRSAAISVGERVVVAGAGGIEHAVDARVVAKQEFAGYWEYLLDEALYTTPPHPHWAGTALISGDGGLVGVGSLYVQQVTPGGTPIDVNMMIPIDLLPPIVDDLMRFGVVKRPSRPWIGMQAAEFGENLVVVGLTDNGPAEAADIRVGDVVTGVGGNRVESLGDLFRGMWGLGEAGITVPLNIFRNGELLEVDISSEDRAKNYKSPKLH
ncbi:MAG: serine protease [Alphaproteobacteria bacterium]|nr:serine protease [Pseudomonadota bacterium]TDI68121.1 MAG: serine protease [Alphaproteobacteria bacterium]